MAVQPATGCPMLTEFMLCSFRVPLETPALREPVGPLDLL